MELSTLIAQWSGKLPPGFAPQAVLRDEPPRCAQPRCTKPASRKPDGSYWKSCDPCRIRRAKSCKRRREALVAKGGCRRCAYRKRLEGDFLCARCREDRDIERAQKRQNALDAAVIDEFAAKPDRAHEPSNLVCLNCGQWAFGRVHPGRPCAKGAPVAVVGPNPIRPLRAEV